VVRRDLVPGLLQTLAKNLRHTADVQAFELGFVAHPEDARSGGGLPYETEQLAFVLTGSRQASSLHTKEPQAVDFFDAKGIVQALLSYLHVEGARFEASLEAPFQPGVCARVSVGDLCLGFVGALHPEVATLFDLEGSHVFVGDFAVDALLAAARPDFHSTEVPRFPSVDLDISLLVDAEVPVARVFDVIHDAGGPLLSSASIFDVYEGKGVPDGQKALAFRIWVNGGDRTLTMEEAMRVRKSITVEMVSSLQATIRE
jgi:phenylalanyl-tRNA synthetase beta chain